jgi:prophage DNA circulation protein
MAQLWDDLLQEGSFGGVRFDFVSARDDGSNTLDKQSFPGRTGQRVEGRSNNGDTISVLAVFVEDDYPETMDDLLAKLRDPTPQRLVHPVRGELKASADTWSVQHEAEDRDSATVSITFAVHTDGDGLTAAKDTSPARANAVRSLATQVLEALSAFQASLEVQNSEIGLAVMGAMSAATDIADSLEAQGDQLSAIAVQAESNVGLAKADEAIALLADYSTTEQFDLSAALLQMAHALEALAQDLINQRPPLSTFAVQADTNLLQLAHDTGQDPEELLALNSFPDPSLIPAGSKFVAYVDRR